MYSGERNASTLASSENRSADPAPPRGPTPPQPSPGLTAPPYNTKKAPGLGIRGLLTQGILDTLLYSVIREEWMRGIRGGSGIGESDPCGIRVS